MAKHRLVQHDTLPQINLWLADAVTNTPLDLSDPLTVARCFFKPVGDGSVKEVLMLVKLPGIVTSIDKKTGAHEVDTAAPYDVPGKGGRCAIQFGPDTLDTVGEFTGEIEVTFAEGGVITVYDREQFDVRADDGNA